MPDGTCISWVACRDYLPIRDQRMMTYYTMNDAENEKRRQMVESHNWSDADQIEVADHHFLSRQS